MKEKNTKSLKFSHILIIAIPIILFCILIGVIQLGVSLKFENWTYYAITKNMSDPLTNVVKVITDIGAAIPVIIICLILIAIPKTRFKYGAPASFSVIVATGLNLVLKRIFCRQRPSILRLVEETNFSFPSGHAMVNSALYFTLILLVIKFVKNKKLKISLSIFLGTLITLIGISRVYLGVHYTFDILGGWLIGFVIAFSSYLIFTNYKKNKIKSE
ncbi:MAG: phosphatase PAP2 family protein [Clostridia bacterium]